MAKNKNKLNKTNSSGWLDNYSEEFSIGKYADGDKVTVKKEQVPMYSDNTRTNIFPNRNIVTQEEIDRVNKVGSFNATKDRLEKEAILQKELEARAAKEKGKKFTLPSGKSKSYKDMTIKEKAYVDGLSLQNKGRWNENSTEQPFLNTFNPITAIYDMAGNLGKAPMEAEVSNSIMPYVTATGTPLAFGAFSGLGTQNTGQFINNAFNPLAGINFKKGSKNINFEDYVTPAEAAKLRAERMLAQKDKWRINNADEVESNFRNIENLFEEVPASQVDKRPTSLGTRQDKAYVFSDAPLSPANKARIAAHETGHFYRNSGEDADMWNSFFDFSKLPKDKREYLKGKKPSALYQYQHKELPQESLVGSINLKTTTGARHADEIRERAAQLKDYIAQKNNIPLNKDFTITKAQLDDAIKNYVKDTKLDNTMSPMLNSLKDKKGFLKMINNSALGLTPAIIGLGAASQTMDYQNGGEINNIMKKKLKKYPAGGYLNYQDAFKGFGIGPNLTQDNTYYRTVAPSDVENIQAEINQPSIFSGINDVLGGVNQAVSQVTGLMSQLPQKGYAGLSPDAKQMFDFSKLLNFGEGKTGLSFDNSNLPSLTSGIGGTPQVFGGFSGGQGNKGILQGISLMGQKNGGYLSKYQNGGMTDAMPLGYPEYLHKSNVFAEHVIPVPKVHFADDTSVFDMGVNLNDLVQMYGGGIRKYQYGGFMMQPRTFNSNSQRLNANQLAAAMENDFMRTKLRNDRQEFADNKVDWGFMNWAKEPTGALLGTLSTVPIVGDITQSALGDSFLTRTGGFQVGQGLGKTTAGAGKIVGGLATGNIGMVGSGIGDVGSGVGSTVGNLSARSAMSDYDKAGYVSGKRLANTSRDFGSMMNTASGLFGNIKGGLGTIKNLGGMEGLMNNVRGGETGMKGFGNFIGKLSGFGFENGGYLDDYQEGGMVFLQEDLEIPKFKKGGLTAKKAREILHDKSVHGKPLTDKQRKYFGYIASQKKSNGGWLDQL